MNKIEENMIKKIILIVNILAISNLSAMKRGTDEANLPEKNDTKRKRNELAVQQALTLDHLPREIKSIILQFLLHASGATETAKLYKAAENLRNFMMMNKELALFLDDVSFNGYLVTQLAQRYARRDIIEAALALGTNAASKWLSILHFNKADFEIIFTKLADAIEAGKLSTINFLFSSISPEAIANIIHEKDLNDNTLLHYACFAGLDKVTAKLITLGARINLNNLRGDRPLIIASRNGFKNIVLQLLAAGVDVNKTDAKGETALHKAAASGFHDIVQLLIREHSLIDAKNNEDQTPLYLAVLQGHLPVVKTLLENGANATLPDYKGNTSLMMAVQNNYVEIVALLLKAGVSVNAVEQNGFSALTIATINGYTQIVTLLMRAGANINYAVPPFNNTILMFAVENEQIPVIDQLLYAGVNVNAKNNAQETALMIAAELGFLEIVKKLIKFNADLNVSDEHGKTPLMAAIESENIEVIAALIKAGADLDLANEDEDTALMIAAYQSSYDIVSALLKAGAQINIKNNSGKTALDAALAANQSENRKQVIQLLQTHHAVRGENNAE